MKNYILILVLLLTQLLQAQCLNKIAAGARHVAALKPDGSVWVFGAEGGKGITGIVLTPTQVNNTPNCQFITSGTFKTFVIKSNGTLWGTGENQYGQIGNGASSIFEVQNFVQIGTANNWKEVSSNSAHTIAVKTNGTLWVWGSAADGALGLGSLPQQNSPVQLGTETNWSSVTSCSGVSVALKTDGSLWSWGYQGCLGNDGFPNPGSTDTPGQVGEFGISTFDWLTVSGGNDSAHAMALKTNGTLWTWGRDWSAVGSNAHGSLGQGTGTIDGGRPQQVGIDNDWVKISCGFNHSLAIKANGTLWAWGENTDGNLGDGTTTDRFVPTQIGTDTDWAVISAGFRFSTALKNNGSLWVWGYNGSNELGNASAGTNILSPQQMPVTGCALANEQFFQENNNLTIAPNPTKDLVTIRYNDLDQNSTIALYDLTGRLINEKLIDNAVGEWQVNTSQYQKGIYIVVVKNNDQNVWQQKLIIE